MKLETISQKNTLIDQIERQRSVTKKIKIALTADPRWPYKNLEFKPMFYLGSIGFEVTIKDQSTFIFITEKIQEAFKILDLKLGTFGIITDKLYLTIWEKSARGGGL